MLVNPLKLNNFNKLAFDSRIEIVDLEEFKQATEGLPEAGIRPWSIDQSLIEEKTFTRKVESCNTGGIQNSEQVFMFHLRPLLTLRNFENVTNIFCEKAEILKKDKKPLNGLITGGDAKDPKASNPDGDLSEELYNELTKMFMGLGINFSVIWGKLNRNQHTNVYYSAKTDTWKINNSRRVKTVNELKRAYKIIRISPNDELWIKGKDGVKRKVEPSEHPELFASG